MAELPTDTSWLRFEQYKGIWGRRYTTDGEGRYRCEDCDALLMRRAKRCPPCEGNAKAARARSKIKGRHRG